MSNDRRRVAFRGAACAAVAACLSLVAGCASDDAWSGGGGGVSTSVSVGVGYGIYYGPGWYGGYYNPYPPVVVVPPGNRPDGERPDRPTTLPSDASAAQRSQMAPSRPQSVQRPTSRPSPRPAPRPMPRMGRR